METLCDILGVFLLSAPIVILLLIVHSFLTYMFSKVIIGFNNRGNLSIFEKSDKYSIGNIPNTCIGWKRNKPWTIGLFKKTTHKINHVLNDREYITIGMRRVFHKKDIPLQELTNNYIFLAVTF